MEQTSLPVNLSEDKLNRVDGWYPSKPLTDNSEVDPDIIEKLRILSTDKSDEIERKWNEIWQTKELNYISSNKWEGISKKIKQASRKNRIDGVEIRRLGADHALCGEYGLFATKKFAPFEIIGEYTGVVKGKDSAGHYVACLEDKPHSETLGLDGQIYGNEMRFINSYLNVSFSENCRMEIAYVDTYPHVMIVCIQAIEIGDEILLNYGEEYNNAYLKPKEPLVQKEQPVIPASVLFKVLAGAESSDDEGSTEDH